jgi:hypothetical protein
MKPPNRASLLSLGLAVLITTPTLFADGLVRPPRDYKGSLEEKAQEAIIVFTPGDDGKSAVEDLILKIQVEGKADDFAWVVPLPSKPETHAEDAALFAECFDYVEARLRPPVKGKRLGGLFNRTESAPAAEAKPVEVLSREVVGSYDVAVVKENEAGALNGWLEREGFQELPGAGEVVGFYREKGYVFACMKVTDTELSKSGSAELHPLRFTFETGGRDGIYFPMKLTGLQKGKFDVNLYVFYGAWLNDHLNGHGFEHRGFELRWRDYDSRECKPNAGKAWSAPGSDSYLSPFASKVPALTRYFQKRHPGSRFYLTNLRARGLEPKDVREWRGDLWMFPYYTNRDFVPHDAREGGPAEGIVTR